MSRTQFVVVTTAIYLVFGTFSGWYWGSIVGESKDRELSTMRDSLRTARYERDDARDSLREARWAFDELSASVDKAHAIVFRDSIPPGKWPRYRFAVRAFPDSTDR